MTEEKPYCFGCQECVFATVNYCIKKGCGNEEREGCYEETMIRLDELIGDEHE